MSDELETALEAGSGKWTDNTLLDNRVLTLFGEVNDRVARRLVERLLALSFTDPEKPITLYISSPGGHVESGDAVFDTMQYIPCAVRTVGMGWVGSIATHIYLAAEAENRFSLPNTRYLIHQPSGGYGGDAKDIQIQATEIVRTRERIFRVIAERTGQTYEKVKADADRDYWMGAEESVEYGLVGRIIRQASELPS